MAEKSDLSEKDGLALAVDFFSSGDTVKALTFDYQEERDSLLDNADSYSTRRQFLVVITPLASSATTISLSRTELELLKNREHEAATSGPAGSWWRKLQSYCLWGFLDLADALKMTRVICALFVLLSFALSLALLSLRKADHDAKDFNDFNQMLGTVGPTHSHTVEDFNFTKWAEETPSRNENFFLRYDDQSLIPMSLLTDKERRFQDWFKQRYPDQVAFVQQETHLDQSWMSSGQKTVPADTQFHIAHCFVSFWRYWMAKETGRHVCTWDLEYAHIHHCFDSMEEWALPPGPTVASDQRPLRWNTKICF